jgi:uncharacterized protein (TIGR02271 family)
MAKTIVGVFDDLTAAQTVVRELSNQGIAPQHVRLMDNAEEMSESSGGDVPWTKRVSNWFGSLVSDEGDRAHAADYSEALRRGHYIVVADVEDEEVELVSDLMNRYGSVDLGRRAEQWKSSGYTGSVDENAQPYTAEEREREFASYASNEKGKEVIPVVQEELEVGKRVVQRGAVRIHSYVEEHPVQEIVRLREEQVKVQRRPVDASDRAFTDREVELTATGEEAVVEKRARVVEEVVLGKEVFERDEKVQGKVRRQDVEVEQVAEPRDTEGASRRS